VTKVDGKDNTKKLKDAEFELKNSEGQWAVVENGKLTGWTTEDKATVLKSGDDGKFVIAGLDAGTYYLKETKAPAGYNLLANEITIEIAATLNTAEDAAALTALTISVDNGKAENGDLASGVVNATVKNNQGSTLPETGGMGTTMFYIFGAILMVGAAVLLITKRRMAIAE
jgi:LPXTG-motif cell wall-anchored protein